MSARKHNENLLKELQEGDLVEFPRGAYSHWSVYIGNGKVVHLAGRDGEASSQSRHVFSIGGKMFDKAEVRVDDFMEVAGESKAKRNNDRDADWSPSSPEDIVEAALSKLGHAEYNLLFKNCEHFAKGCRYGKEHSDQVMNVLHGP